MKKKLLVVAAVLVICIAFVACGGKDMSDSPYLGTWTATIAEYSGIEVSVESIVGGEFSFILEDDGSCTGVIAGKEESGSWEETDKGFNVEDEFDLTVEGEMATLDYDGITLYFERQ